MFALLATRCSIARYSKQHYCEHCATCTSLSNHKNLPEHQHIAACVYTSLSSSSKRSTYGHTHTGTNTYLFAPLCAVVSVNATTLLIAECFLYRDVLGNERITQHAEMQSRHSKQAHHQGSTAHW
eukprot:15792-Heterococcus_DN1.PRE.1